MSKNITEITAGIKQKSRNRKKRVKFEINETILPKCIESFKIIATAYEPNFDSKHIEGVIKQLVEWSHHQGKTNPQIGILMNGKSGRGKTLLIKTLLSYLEIDGFYFFANDHKFKVGPIEVDAKSLQIEFDANGIKAIYKFINAPVLFLDDIGKEKDVIQYGRESIINAVIDERERRGLMTFATTNVSKLSDIYDSRTISRMKSHFNIISINHDVDYREKTK